MTTDTGIIARIQSRSATLTQAEARLVEELMRVPREIALATAADFAARVGVHEATTSRLARKLDFPSYSAFRDALRREFLRQSDPADRMSATLSAAGGQPLSHLIAVETAAIADLAAHVGDAAIAAAAKALDGRRIFLFAHGHATALAAMAERRLRRMGIEARVLSGNARDLAEQALALDSGDALILFAFRRQPRGYAPLMQVARDLGVVTLALSDTLGPALVPTPDRLLSAPRGGVPGSFQTLTVPMLLLNALILALGELRGTQSLDRLGALIERFEEERNAS